MKKIFVIEDDKFLANAYRVKFTKSGFDVKLAMDGKEALEIAKDPEYLPDVVVLDLVMPGQDGFAVLQSMRQEDTYSRYKKVPICVASNLGHEEDIKKAVDMGASDYIVKSNESMASIVEKINKITGK